MNILTKKCIVLITYSGLRNKLASNEYIIIKQLYNRCNKDKGMR